MAVNRTGKPGTVQWGSGTPPGGQRLRERSAAEAAGSPTASPTLKTTQPAGSSSHDPTENSNAPPHGIAQGPKQRSIRCGSLPASVSLVVSWRPLARVRDTPLYDGYSYERRDTEGHRGYGPIA